LFFGLLPLTVLFFERIAVLAPLVNLIVVPIFSLLTVPATLAAVVATTIDLSIAEYAVRLAAIGVRMSDQLIAATATLSPSGSTAVERPGLFAFLPWLALLWVLLPRGWPGRALALLVAVCLLQPVARGPSPGCVDLHVLDVGQGQSVVVRTANHTLLYDTGPAYRSGGSAAGHVIVPFLERLGVSYIDWLIVSHADLDHAGGLHDLASALAIGRVIASEALAVPGLNTFACQRGQRWHVDGVDIAVLHPGPATPVFGDRGNDGSCVLQVAAGRHRALLSGDIEIDAENQLLALGMLRRSAFVTVPHHGSRTSSGPAFINRLDPDFAVASTGYSNRWNFPADRIRRRWEGAGARFYDTGADGAVSTTLCRWRAPRGVRTERHERRRFWHADAESQ
ncbi:MAG: DNA internalization-related competence protein ComEC/Rec2, partial [Pseudomonadota bacterium]